MTTKIREYLISGEKATRYGAEIYAKASLKELPAKVKLIGVEGRGLVDMRYYLHIEKGASVKIKPEQKDKLRITVIGENSAQKTAESQLEEIFGGKID